MTQSDRPVRKAVAELAEAAPMAPTFGAIESRQRPKGHLAGSLGLVTVSAVGVVLIGSLVLGVLIAAFGLGPAAGTQGGQSTLPLVGLLLALVAWGGLFVATTRIWRRKPWLALVLGLVGIAIAVGGFLLTAALS